MEAKKGKKTSKAVLATVRPTTVSVIPSPSVAGRYRLKALTAQQEVIGELLVMVTEIDNTLVLRLDRDSWAHHAKNQFIDFHLTVEQAFPGKHILIAPHTVEFCELIKEGE